jgi:hypothetical protein
MAIQTREYDRLLATDAMMGRCQFIYPRFDLRCGTASRGSRPAGGPQARVVLGRAGILVLGQALYSVRSRTER